MGAAVPLRCWAPAFSLPAGQDAPPEGQEWGSQGGAETWTWDHYTYRNPPGGRERDTKQLGAWGMASCPPRPHPQETHQSSSIWGGRKSTGTARGWHSWHSLASSGSKVGVPEPTLGPPRRAGWSLEREEQL